MSKIAPGVRGYAGIKRPKSALGTFDTSLVGRSETFILEVAQW